jgi:hypothetical protein
MVMVGAVFMVCAYTVSNLYPGQLAFAERWSESNAMLTLNSKVQMQENVLEKQFSPRQHTASGVPVLMSSHNQNRAFRGDEDNREVLGPWQAVADGKLRPASQHSVTTPSPGQPIVLYNTEKEHAKGQHFRNRQTEASMKWLEAVH